MGRFWPLTLRGCATIMVAVAFLVAAGRFGSVQLLAFAVLLVTLTALALILLHAGRTVITLHRSWSPPSAAVGDRVSVTVHVRVRTALTSPPGTWLDEVPEGLVGRTDGRFPALASGMRGGERAVDLVYELEATRRGIHTLGPLRLTVRDPFGLTRRRRDIGQTTSLVVEPECVELPPLNGDAGSDASMRQTSTTRLGQGSDNLIARPYEPGDSMRRIHWRATAHRDELMVRQEERESTPEAIIVLDRAAGRWSPQASVATGADPAFESAVRACVSVVTTMVRDGYTVQVVDGGGHPLAAPVEGGDRTAARALVHRFASVTARGDAHLAAFARSVTGGTVGPVIVITGTLDDDDVTTLASVPAHSTHPVLLCAATDDALLEAARVDGWAVASVTADDDLHERWQQVARFESVGGGHGRP